MDNWVSKAAKRTEREGMSVDERLGLKVGNQVTMMSTVVHNSGPAHNGPTQRAL